MTKLAYLFPNGEKKATHFKWLKNKKKGIDKAGRATGIRTPV
jgi:hypothetical protein